MDTEERKDFLDAECGDDRELRRHLESLILSGKDSRNLLEEVIGDEAASFTGVAAGERIGQYTVVRKLGEGGMGSVYLAVRSDDEYRKQVAIKLMRPDLLARSSLRRFRTERQILANLDHPGIARLLDGGTSSWGAPYVVMEYVDGVPVDAYCQLRAVQLKDRLGIFIKIAD